MGKKVLSVPTAIGGEARFKVVYFSLRFTFRKWALGVLCDYDHHEVNSHVTRLFLFLVHHIPHTPPPPTLPYRIPIDGDGGTPRNRVASFVFSV